MGGGGTGDGVLATVKPDSSGEVKVTVAAEEITLNDDNNIITGAAKELNCHCRFYK